MVTTLCIIGLVLIFLFMVADSGFIVTVLSIVATFFIVKWLATLGNKNEERARQENPELWQKRDEEEAERKKQADAKKYHNYVYTCSMCGSHKIRKLSFDEKTMPFQESSLVGKNYKCDDCKYIW